MGDPKAFVANVEHFKTILLNPHFHLETWHGNTWINALSTLLWHGSFYRNGVGFLCGTTCEPKRGFARGLQHDHVRVPNVPQFGGCSSVVRCSTSFPVVTINGRAMDRSRTGSVQEIKEFVDEHEGRKIIIDLLLCYPGPRRVYRHGSNDQGKQLVCNGLETLNQRNWLTFQQNCQELKEFLGIDVMPGIWHVKEKNLTSNLPPRKHRPPISRIWTARRRKNLLRRARRP